MSGFLISAVGTTISLVRTGRVLGAFEAIEEERGFVLSVVDVATGGWFVGRLEIVFTTRCLSWAAPVGAKTKLMNNAQNDRYEIFFKFFKTYTPKIFLLARARLGTISGCVTRKQNK